MSLCKGITFYYPVAGDRGVARQKIGLGAMVIYYQSFMISVHSFSARVLAR